MESNWIKKNIKTNLKDRIILITGGHSGIGYAMSKHCLSLGMKVIWASRNIDKCNKAKTEIYKEIVNPKINIVILDLADISSIKRCAEEIINNFPHLDYLYNNAGVYRIDKSHTKDNLDLTIGTNVIGTYLFTKLLVDHYCSTQDSFKVIFTTSLLAHNAKIDYEDFLMEKKYSKIKAYSNSKLETFHIYNYFINQDKFKNLKCILMHPGSTYTPLIEKGYKNNFIKRAGKGFMKLFFHSPLVASLSALYGLNDNINNCYIVPRGLIHISGYPKVVKIPKRFLINYVNTVNKIENLIQ